MSNKTFMVKDKLFLKDNMAQTSRGLFAKTEVIGGYGLKLNPNGKSSLGEVLFKHHNIVPIGGVSYAFEKIYGVEDTQLTIPTLYDEAGIGHSNSEPAEDEYLSPDGTTAVVYRPGNFVQLFGLGLTGSGENDITIYDPSYRENSINLSTVTNEGLTVHGIMYPFRYSSSELSTAEKQVYFGKKTENDVTGYYLKRFSTHPAIKHIWDVGVDDEEEELVSSGDIWSNEYSSNGITSFSEMYLTIGKKDLREYFDSIGEFSRARFNTIALYTGEYVVDDESGEDGEYRDVRLFSKCCIPPEYLATSKDLQIIYRVYGV